MNEHFTREEAVEQAQPQGEPEKSLYELLRMGAEENNQLGAQIARMDRLLHFKAAIEASPQATEPAPCTDICRNCAGQGWEPSVNNGKVPCSFCQPAPSTAGERDRTIVSLPIPASASDLKSDIAELIQSHKYKGLRSIEVLGVFQFLGAEIISGSNS